MTRHSSRGAVLAVLAAAVLSLAATAPLWAQATPVSPSMSTALGSGTITGRLEFGSPGAGDLSSANVLALPVSADGSGQPVTGTVGPSGAFTVTGLTTDDAIIHRIVARFEGEDYLHSDDIVLTESSPNVGDISLTVYATDPRTALGITNGHMLIAPRPEQGTLRVTEVWIVHNGSGYVAVSGGEDSTLALLMPKGARSLAFADPRLRNGASFSGDELLIDAGFLPGDTEVAIGYDLPYAGSEMTFVRAVDAPVEALQIIAMEPNATIESETLGPVKTMEVESGTIVVAEGASLPADQRVRVRVAGLPVASESGGDNDAFGAAADPIVGQESLAWLGMAVTLLGALAGLAYPLVLSRPGHGRRDRLEAEYEASIDALARLEAHHASGRVGGPAYAAERAELVGRAVQLARTLD